MAARIRARDLQVAGRFLVESTTMRVKRRYAASIQGDPLSRVGLWPWTDPYATYATVRARGPLSQGPLPDIFVSADHAVCKEVLRSRTFVAVPRERQVGRSSGEFDLSLLEMNPPDHTRLRKVAAPAFAPRRMPGYATQIERRIHALLDAVPAGETFDLQRALSRPLPIGVISDLLGIPDADAATFTRYGKALGSALDGIQSLRHGRQALEAKTALDGMFTRLLAQRRNDPAEDMISILAAATDEDDPAGIRGSELLPLCQLLLVAGFETTVNLIGNAVHHLLTHPAQWRALADDPSLATAVVEETLRYDSPVQLTSRMAEQPIDLGGRTLRRGDWVVTLIGGANRDPKVYRNADEFDIFRADGGDHLSFSAGIHYCLGAPLARLEAEVALRVLADRMPQLHLTGPVPMLKTRVLRGVAELPVAG